MDSILDSVKKNLGIDPAYTAFDADVTMHINSIFSVLHQVGIGPTAGFAIDDNTAVWGDFLADDVLLNHARTYVYLRVRLLFDPPTTSYLLKAVEDQYKELEWRMNTYREETAWTEPVDPDLIYLVAGDE